MKRFILPIIFYFAFCTPAFAELTLITKINGITGDALTNAEQRLQELKENYGNDLSEKNIEEIYHTAPQNIQKALEPYGFFKSHITPLGLIRKKDQWTAYFSVDPGSPVRLEQVNVTASGPGKDDPELTKLLNDFPLKKGQALETDRYDKAKETLFHTVNNQGYLKAYLTTKEIRVNLQTLSATIILHLETGPRYYFGPVSYSSTPFSENFLRRFESFHAGEPFSSEKLLKFQQDLSGSRYFTQVIVTPEIDKANNLQIPSAVMLTVPKAKQYNIGFGYGTFTGPRLTFSTDWRRVGKEGQHFTTQLKYSPVLKGVAAKYFIPGRNPLTDQYMLGADIQEFSPKNGDSFSENFSASYLKTMHEWQNNLTLNYLIERYQVVDNPSEISRLFYPSYTLSRIKTDNMIYPRFGSMVSFTIQGSNEHVLSSTSFIQGEIKGKYIFSPSENGRFILRGDLGYTIVNDLSRLPLTLRFFAGGLGSVRGYPYSSLGPGRYLETASIEYQHKLIGDFYGAVFYDAGTATNHFNDALQRGEGAGIIYRSLIGPIEVDVGRAMSLPGKPCRVEFSIGPDF